MWCNFCYNDLYVFGIVLGGNMLTIDLCVAIYIVTKTFYPLIATQNQMFVSVYVYSSMSYTANRSWPGYCDVIRIHMIPFLFSY